MTPATHRGSPDLHPAERRLTLTFFGSRKYIYPAIAARASAASPSETPTVSVTLGTSARYDPVTVRAGSASGPVQSRNHSMTTASVVFGTAPATDSRLTPVRCAISDR